MEALFERASMLHRIEIARPRSVIGRTTTQSLQSGLLFGYAGMVDAMVERIRGELGAEARVIATGGLAQLHRRRDASRSSASSRSSPSRACACCSRRTAPSGRAPRKEK